LENKEDLKRLLDYYLFSDLDDEVILDSYLSEKEIDHEAVANRISDLLRQKRAELILQKGRKFKENYLKLKNEITVRNSENEFDTSGLALAYRKKSGNSEKDDDTDSSIMDIIKQAKKKTT